ncbi:MAG: SDR family oxidoreductase [Proteobacteria bacterium]|nr:SDR family oxidoreductase [Pseudomonadota bacterium]NDC23719.1 SDR family oxidoreductase [Pseudomonadota bacterium]NDD03912.1 SDR family oxidoreductase [Pseudomonadota bacterium]NDG27064.1 SDR family oxidoreductase [Pseudomonadota bacterium]
MEILILGGTSFFGKDIVRAFFEAGHTVTVFTRGLQKPTDLPHHHQITGDRNSVSDLNTVAKGKDWDVVIDNIGYDQEGAAKVVKAFRGAKHFIFDSTVSVYRFVRNRNPQPLTEESVDYDFSPPQEDRNDIHWKYARGKLEAEKLISKECKVPWTIIRPPVVYGPFDTTQRGFWYVARLLDGGPILLPNGGNQSFRLVYSKDVAKAFLLAAGNPRAFGKAFYVGQKEIITLKDFIDESARVLGVTPRYVNIPRDILGELGGPHSSMVNMIVDFSLAEKELGFKPTPFSEFMRETTLWFKEHWKGNREELLKTRAQELIIAQKWKNVIDEFC